jgi:hypothetical protein
VFVHGFGIGEKVPMFGGQTLYCGGFCFAIGGFGFAFGELRVDGGEQGFFLVRR